MITNQPKSSQIDKRTQDKAKICWQAYNDRRPIVILLVNPYVPSQSRGQMLRFLQRFQEECGECFFWAAETSSQNGKKVLEKYGSGGDDQLIFLVPSTQQAPIFVDRIEGEVISGYNIGKLYDRIKCMIQGINIEREQLNKMKSNEVEKGSEPHFSNLKHVLQGPTS
ncbi:uncharacterized protein LOC141890725 [Acropora palmata]|uniref:uncharacterized protein LOC141890725 n=1 Tax=Acropora palmata TaxID=6131 RepID=UPI003D9FBAD4